MSRQGITASEAARTILADARPLPAESADLRQAAGRILAGPVVSPMDVPPWDNSAMDGYAVRSEDLRPGALLSVIETVAAGAFPAKPPAAGEAVRIFTGAPLPPGCDGVVRQEDTTVLPDGRVRINEIRDAHRHVRARGEDIRRGSTVFETGTELRPAHIGVLASLAMPVASVHRRPRVALLGSGDEIADLDQADAIRAGRKIASSNSYTLAALLGEIGAEILDLGIARDDPEDLHARLLRGLDADVLITTAGVSVGEHDHVRTVMDRLGLELRFWRIRMRPGAPVGYGLIRGKPWLGLPGNPVSAMVTFELFARPLLRALAGHAGPFRRTVKVRLAEPVSVGGRLQHFLRAIVTDGDSGLAARLTGPQGSGMLTSMARANALLILAEGLQEADTGEELPALRLDETAHVAQPPF